VPKVPIGVADSISGDWREWRHAMRQPLNITALKY